MTILSVVGARPQFIKAATVSRVIRETGGLDEVLVHTGQHYDHNLSDVFFDRLRIPEPDYNLGIGSASHGAQTGRMLERIEEVIQTEEPDVVLVYGDTNSTLAAALAAAKLNISVAHVEAGLRSFNRSMPEEVNRVLTDHVSDFLFVPTRVAVENLRQEGVDMERIHFVGDVMYDAAEFYKSYAHETVTILDDLSLSNTKYILATIHRAENTDDTDRLIAIFDGLARVAENDPVVLPLHPRTRNALDDVGQLAKVEASLRVIEPVGYLEMIRLEQEASVIITDSGGVQKEAYFHKVPCITLRDETEWVELVEAGWNDLLPPAHVDQLPERVEAARGSAGNDDNLYGDATAASAIIDIIKASARPS